MQIQTWTSKMTSAKSKTFQHLQRGRLSLQRWKAISQALLQILQEKAAGILVSLYYYITNILIVRNESLTMPKQKYNSFQFCRKISILFWCRNTEMDCRRQKYKFFSTYFCFMSEQKSVTPFCNWYHKYRIFQNIIWKC